MSVHVHEFVPAADRAICACGMTWDAYCEEQWGAGLRVTPRLPWSDRLSRAAVVADLDTRVGAEYDRKEQVKTEAERHYLWGKITTLRELYFAAKYEWGKP